MIIKILGWEEGFKKVSLNKILREHYGFNIKEAKVFVDKILRREQVTLEVDQLVEFDRQVAGIGIIYEIG